MLLSAGVEEQRELRVLAAAPHREIEPGYEVAFLVAGK